MPHTHTRIIVLQTAVNIRRLWAWHICAAFAMCASCPTQSYDAPQAQTL